MSSEARTVSNRGTLGPAPRMSQTRWGAVETPLEEERWLKFRVAMGRAEREKFALVFRHRARTYRDPFEVAGYPNCATCRVLDGAGARATGGLDGLGRIVYRFTPEEAVAMVLRLLDAPQLAWDGREPEDPSWTLAAGLCEQLRIRLV